jgi:2-hydroxychromene-2-carboxylate isomerase
MPATIDYYLTCVSPWTYLGHEAILAIAAKHGARLNIKPVNLGEMFKVSGQVGLADRPVVRQRYRLIELQRHAEARGKEISLKPKFFPTNPALADQTICAIVADGGDPTAYMGSVFAAVWVEDKQIADEAVLAELLTAAGFDAQAVLARAKQLEIAAIRARNTEDAIAVDATGVPSFVLNGEPFWGQDRIDLLDRALTSGRAPFKVPA